MIQFTTFFSFFVILKNGKIITLDKKDIKEEVDEERGVKYNYFAINGLEKGAVITDASGRRDCLHMELPTPEAFIRFVGNGGKYLESDKARVDEWVLRIKEWLANGLQQVYFFLHQHDEADTPLIADYTIEQFNKHLGSDLSRINFINKNSLLF